MQSRGRVGSHSRLLQWLEHRAEAGCEFPSIRAFAPGFYNRRELARSFAKRRQSHHRRQRRASSMANVVIENIHSNQRLMPATSWNALVFSPPCATQSGSLAKALKPGHSDIRGKLTAKFVAQSKAGLDIVHARANTVPRGRLERRV